jgi:hypothetical protein
MPFGPTNGPVTFINFAHDICSVWQEEARRHGVPIGDQYNTRIIVDDFVNWGKDLALALLYMRCQLMVCQAYNLSLSLKKAKIFPARFEFVGVDVCSDGNRPARSKYVLLETCPDPIEVRKVAKFIGFGQFYSRFIPNLSFVSCPFAVLHPMNTPHRWVTCGHLMRRRHSTTSNQLYWTTLVFSALIIKS